MKTKGDIITIGLNLNEVTSCEGLKFIPHEQIDKISVNDLDLFLIPGGPEHVISGNPYLIDLLKKLNKKQKIIGTICSGSNHLINAGILSDKSSNNIQIGDCNEILFKDNIIIDDNIVIAKANAYVDFAIELGKIMKIYEDNNDLLETVDFFKYFKSIG
jgi:hypothetical protein